ncbi:hypothetical protein D3C72_1891440 [compost metagenome]
MQSLQGGTVRALRHALLLCGMGDGIDGGVDGAAVLAGMRGQRGVLAHRRRPVPQHHGLKDRVAMPRVHGAVDQARQRFSEKTPQRRVRRAAARRVRADLFDHQRDRRCGIVCPGG